MKAIESVKLSEIERPSGETPVSRSIGLLVIGSGLATEVKFIFLVVVPVI